MAKETAKTSAGEATPPQDPLAGAKAAFQAAVEKTNEKLEKEGEEKVVVEAVKAEAPAKKAPAPKPAQKPAPVKKPEPTQESSELAKVRSELESLKAKLAEPPKKEEAKPTDYDAVQAELSEQFGEEEGAILGRTLRALLEPREQRISQLEKLIERAVEQSKAQAAKSNRSRLAKEYEHLGESDDAWGIIQSQAQALFAKGGHGTIEEAFDEVAHALYGAVKEKVEEEAEEEASRIAASTPTQPSAAKREKKLSREDRARALFDHLYKDPEDAAGAKKLAKELRIDH